MALTKEDLQDIKEVVVEATEPYFEAIQKDFNNVSERFDGMEARTNKRFDRLESLINDDYKQRIEKLEDQVQELRDALAMK